jgi:tape measure domain-containing protein
MEALKKAIEFTSGSVSAGVANFQFLEEAAQKLGLPIQAAAEGFKSMSAAANRAGITFLDQQKMFLDLSRGMAALSMTAQDASLVFFGFGQLLSKNKVSAQELYHQIGERLPIAMQAAQIAAAKVTGQVEVTSAQLIKLVEDGKLMSSEFAPAFTEAIGKIAGEAANIDTLGKNFTRLGNAWDNMLTSMGESTQGFWYETTKFLTKAIEDIAFLMKDIDVLAKEQQGYRFDQTIKRYKNASKEFLDLMIEQKEQELKVEEVGLQVAEKLNALGESDETLNKLERSKYMVAGVRGELDALLKLRTELSKQTNKGLDDEEGKTKKLEKLYKILIAQQEALMKAEEDLIKSRTKAGPNQDILILENRVNFNNKMLAIDQDARFKELELAKNNAVKRKAELQKDAEEEQEIVRQARFKAFAAETEYLEKTLEFIRDNAKKRRQQLQTDEQNELEDSKSLVNEKIKVLTEEYDKAKKIEAQSKNSLELLETNYQDALTKLTEEGNKERAAIRERYRQKEQADLMKAELEVRSTVVEAATIRNVALAKSESEKASIAEEGAITQLNIKKEENTKLAQLQLEQGNLTEAQQKIINNKLEADNLLLDAQITQIVKEGEERRRKEREEKANMVLEIGQTVADGLFNIYNQQLNNELTALNNKYNEEVRLADGNKQKLAELEQKKNEKEKELKIKQFRADQMAATARVIFSTASQIMASALNPALIPYIVGLSIAQLAAIAAQPVPEFAEGTKGKPFKGGPAIVGERGVEKVVTQSGKVYYTPPTATLIDLPKGSQVIPNHALTKKELFMANALNQGRPIGSDSAIVPKLDEIGGILKSLPVHQVNMNEKGFEKFIRTPRRTTKILNSQFPSKF